MPVQIEAATVYRGGGRRWFSLAVAARREAMAVIRKRYPCECDSGDRDTPPENCGWHPDGGVPEYETRLRRLTRLYIAAAQPTQQGERNA